MKVKSKVWAGLRKKIGDPARPDDVDTLRRAHNRQIELIVDVRGG